MSDETGKGESRKVAKYKGVNIYTDLWKMVSTVCAMRGLTTAEYLDAILREPVKKDFQTELGVMVDEQKLELPPTHTPTPPRPRKRPGGE